ncbi:MAG: DUF4861 family protein [Bacteroidota bacterium]
MDTSRPASQAAPGRLPFLLSSVLPFLIALAATASAQVPTPRDLAQRVAEQTIERTDFRLVPEVEPLQANGAYKLDVFDGFEAHAGGVYVARATLTVDEGATSNPGSPFEGGLAAARLGVSPAPGVLAVEINGQPVLRLRSDSPARVDEIDYTTVVYEHAVAVDLPPGEHDLALRFTPATDDAAGGRVYLGFFDGNTGLRFRGVTLAAPHTEAAAFAVLGPLRADTPSPPLEVARIYPGATGAVRWNVPRRNLVSHIAEPLAYSDWRYFSGTVLDAMREVSDAIPGLETSGYVDRHLDFFLSNVEAVRVEREAYGLTESPFGHYFRYTLLDDIGMQTVPFLSRLEDQAGPMNSPEGELVERGVRHILDASLRLPDGTWARVNTDSLTVWADDLFMGGVLMARAGRALDGDLANRALDEAARQTLAIDRLLRDPALDVYHHGYFARTGERSSSRWGRANGWTMLAKTDILRHLPEAHPQYDEVLAVFQRHAAGLLALQSADGRWHQVLDNPDTFLETTATAAFVRAFAEGIVQGWLPEAGYREAVERGWAALARQVRPDGTVEGIVPGTPIYFEDAQYQARGPRLHDPRGLGAVLYAAASVHRLHAMEAASGPEAQRLEVRNPLDEARPDAFVVVPRDRLGGLRGPLVVSTEAGEVPSQRDDLDGDGRWDELAFVLDLGPGETATVTVAPGEPQAVAARTQADLQVREGGSWSGRVYRGGAMVRVTALDVPAAQAQDSEFAYAEGPTWETDRVGFRVYMDDRARVDVFGKTGGPPALHDLGPDYHAINDWGTDVLKVGASLGLGTPAALLADGSFQTLGTPDRVEVVASGPVRSLLRWTVDAWTVEGETYRAVWEVEARAGQRHSLSRLHVTRADGAPADLALATGIVRHPEAPDRYPSVAPTGALVPFTVGPQADQGDGLALGLVLPERYAPSPVPSDDTHAYRLRPDGGRVEYLLAATWALERDPLPRARDVAQYLESAALRHATPVVVR